MKIWIDIASAAQVLFLRPIITELMNRGVTLLITTRRSTELVPLADKYGLAHTVVGAHGGATLLGKGLAIGSRAARLIKFVRNQGIDLALSHGSYSQAIAAAWLRAPLIVFQDYEGHPANHILCRAASRILVPNVFSKTNLRHFGASEARIESYNGLKENVYLADFKPDPLFLDRLGIPSHKIIVTMRPPSLVSTYHRFPNPLFDELLDFILSLPTTFVVLLPRGTAQRLKYANITATNLLIPETVIDGPDLIYHSDMVVGAGGTMNREAAVLGTPVYSVFKGELGSVDQHLIGAGKMARVDSRSDFSRTNVCKKPKLERGSWQLGRGLVVEIVDKLLGSFAS